jgi:hypothetical protein
MSSVLWSAYCLVVMVIDDATYFGPPAVPSESSPREELQWVR